MEEKIIITPANHTNAPVKNFAALGEEYSNPKKAKVTIIQAPYEKTVTYKKGTKNGPGAIIDASRNMELLDDELGQETYKIGIHTAEPLALEHLEPSDMVAKVKASVLEALKGGKFPVLLGGEHSVSVGAVAAVKELYPTLSVLHLDAHYDLRDEFRGSKLNHGCVARRISEICPIVEVGVRSLSKEEKDFLTSQASSNIKTVSVYDILEMPLWKDHVSRNLSEYAYITIDLDVFDPSVMPAVGTPEPGGMGWYEMLDLLKEISKDKKVVGFDVVELSPIDNQVASDFLAAKLLYRLLGYIFSGKR